ncbi:MAG TPA: PatB family C-S lyase [Deltaproteobacteria bacterium]|nr:PatB family C-S lyase [Deltaproteobacteria bacterium]HON62987.1 PatB family C-S lyase [Deltaproteobacteria bacterium]HRR21808.1 PatB family C-S lyase [Desulfomonilia bacterium]HRR69713.1 PatB family C-S lyase [Desulfomonilia bacterium]HRT45612.1 PatB family C-S lyase [Desulfomonilia bacterium]
MALPVVVMISRQELRFDFDTPVERRGTGSLKWDRYKGRDVIPLWVADMDFKAPPAVIEALRERVDHGVFGYTLPPGELVNVIVEMLEREHAWKADPQWLVWLPGLVTGINVACRSVGAPGDAVMTTTPAYPPFLGAPALSGRTLIAVPHRDDSARYVFDFEGMEQAESGGTRLFFLCNPQNPTGRVFTREELMRLAQICLRHGIVICSDEIHCGLVLDPDARHVSIAALDREIARQSITLLSPSKTYNLPGLGFSLAVIPDRDLRMQFRKSMEGIVPHVNAFGCIAALAAYRDCGQWRSALLDYLRANRDMVESFVAGTPGISMHHVEATYLAWIDCRALGAEDPASLFERCGVGLSNGRDFGAPGYVRLNFGCARSTLAQALDRMETAIRSHAG